MDNDTSETLTNAEIVTVNKDGTAPPGRRIGAEGAIEIWARPLARDATAFGFVNRGEEPAQAVVPFERLRLSPRQLIRDVWAHRNLDADANGLAVSVEPHVTAVFVCRPA